MKIDLHIEHLVLDGLPMQPSEAGDVCAVLNAPSTRQSRTSP